MRSNSLEARPFNRNSRIKLSFEITKASEGVICGSDVHKVQALVLKMWPGQWKLCKVKCRGNAQIVIRIKDKFAPYPRDESVEGE
jgi:hypothetical protein